MGGDKDGELLYMATWLLLWVQHQPILQIKRFQIHEILRKNKKNMTVECYKIKSGSLFIETHREQYYINLLSILLKCSPLPIEILTAVGESFVTVTMISMN